MVDNSGSVPIAADVLIAPHHGADNGSSTTFIQTVNPTHVIFPSGMSAAIHARARWTGISHTAFPSPTCSVPTVAKAKGTARLKRTAASGHTAWLTSTQRTSGTTTWRSESVQTGRCR